MSDFNVTDTSRYTAAATTGAAPAIKAKDEAARLKEKYGDTYRVAYTIEPDDETEISREYFFKRPTTASFDRYAKTSSKVGLKALKVFMLDSIVEESREQLENDLEKYPAMVLSLGEKLLTMMGFSQQVNLKQL